MSAMQFHIWGNYIGKLNDVTQDNNAILAACVYVDTYFSMPFTDVPLIWCSGC